MNLSALETFYLANIDSEGNRGVRDLLVREVFNRALGKEMSVEEVISFLDYGKARLTIKDSQIATQLENAIFDQKAVAVIHPSSNQFNFDVRFSKNSDIFSFYLDLQNPIVVSGTPFGLPPVLQDLIINVSLKGIIFAGSFQTQSEIIVVQLIGVDESLGCGFTWILKNAQFEITS